MTLKNSLIAISATAFFMCSGVTLKAQTPPDQTPPSAAAPTDTKDVADRRDDFDLGWLGLIGLLGLGGLAGRRRDVAVGTTRPRT
jgi:MYXO-CTERM domain-containing protein